MSEASEKLKAELRAAIAATDDAHYRAFLMLMQAIYEAMVTGFKDLNDKVDSVLTNETELRERVFNGHSEAFDPVMRWATEEMAFSPRQRKINQWAEERMAHAGYCQWAEKKMAAEAKEEQDNADSKRRIRDAILEKIAIGIISSLSTAAGLLLFFGGK